MAIDKIDRVVINRELLNEIDSKATKAELGNTKTELQNQINSVVTSLEYKEAVELYSDLSIKYPLPKEGWTVAVKENGVTYKYTKNQWVDIGLTSTPKATNGNDGLLSKEDYKKLATVSENAEKNLTAAEILEDLHSIGGINADTVGGKPVSDFSPKEHDHDGRYYTKTESNTLLNGKAASSHSHDSKDISDNAVTDDKIGNRTINQSITTAYNNTGNITQLFSWLAKRIKDIIGVTNWYDNVPASLTDIWNKFKAGAGHKHTGTDGDGSKISYNDLIDTPNSLLPTDHKHKKSDITDFSHGHAISEISNLQNTLNNKSEIHTHPYASENHNHNDTYYTKTENDNLLKNKSDTHTHPYASDTHNHNTLYYTKTESNNLLNEKANANHTHENIGAKVNIGSTAPASPKVNEIWVDTN